MGMAQCTIAQFFLRSNKEKHFFESCVFQTRLNFIFSELRSSPGGGHSITKHTGWGGGGLARRSESKTPKYLSKNGNFRKTLKSYPLNILKVMSESSKTNFHFQ